MEFYIAFCKEEFRKNAKDFYPVTLEKSIKQYKTVLENTEIFTPLREREEFVASLK